VRKLLILFILIAFASTAQFSIMSGSMYPARNTGAAAPLDTVPNVYAFTDVTGATISTVYTSNTVTIAGLTGTATIRITGGTYSKNGAGYVSTQGTITNGNTVTVRATSSASYSTAVNAVVTIGGVSDTYTVTTGADPNVHYAAIASRNSRSFFVAINAYKETAMTNRATLDGDNVRAIKDYTSSQSMEFTNSTPTNPLTSNTGQTSTFYGALWGAARTYPPFETKLGGSVVMSNVSYKEFTTDFSDLPFPHEMTTVLTWFPTVYGEFITSGCYSFSLRRGYVDNLMVQWGCIGGEQTRASGTWRGAFVEKVILHQTIYANNWMTTRWTYSGGDQIKVDSVLLSVGPGVIRNQSIFSNGHPPNAKIHATWIKTGAAHTPTTRQQDINSAKQIWSDIGQTPNEPFCVPVLTEGGSGTGTYFDLSWTYNDGGTGLPIDLDAVVINWGGTKRPASGCSGCNFLDIQQLLKTTDGHTTRFYVNEFPAFFTGDFNQQTVTIGMECPNTNGDSYGIVTAENGYY
jgi:hypothetical protein